MREGLCKPTKNTIDFNFIKAFVQGPLAFTSRSLSTHSFKKYLSTWTANPFDFKRLIPLNLFLPI